MPEFFASHTPRTPAPKLPNVATRYGAPMGRGDVRPAGDLAPRGVSVRRVDLDSGGYDSGGAYWGTGAPLYRATSACGTLDSYFRAPDRAAALRHVRTEYPEARFESPGAETRATRREELESFIRGYFETAEWLWPEESESEGYGFDRDRVRGWSRSAVRTMRADCAAFYDSNRADLRLYVTESGRGMESAGGDFFLDREGHGAGFRDRGNGDVFRRLAEAAEVWGEYGHPWLCRGWVRID